MNLHTKKISGRKVTFVLLGDEAGFFFTYKKKQYGNFVELSKMDTFDKDYFWQILNDNARETLLKLKKGEQSNTGLSR